MNKDEIRELGNAECFYYLYDKIAPTNFSVVAELNEGVSLDAVNRALKSVLNKYQVFQAQVDRNAKGRLTFVNAGTAQYRVDIMVQQDVALTDFLAKEINTPISEPVRVAYLEGQRSDPNRLVFTFDHVRTDAAPAVQIVQQVIQMALAQSQPSADGLIPIFPPVESLFPPEAQGFSLIGLLWRYIRRTRSFQRQFGEVPKLDGTGSYNFADRKLILRHLTITADQTRQITKACSQGGFTVHHYLSALQLAAIRSMYKQIGDLPLILSMPVSLRNRLPRKIDPNLPGLFLTIPKLNLAANSLDGIPDLARKVKNALNDQISEGEYYLLWKLFKSEKNPDGPGKLQQMEERFSKNPSSSMITNLGWIPDLDDQGSSCIVKGLHFAVAPPKDALMCTAASTFKDVLTLNCCFNEDLMPEPLVDQYLESYRKLLNSTLERPALI